MQVLKLGLRRAFVSPWNSYLLFSKFAGLAGSSAEISWAWLGSLIYLQSASLLLLAGLSHPWKEGSEQGQMAE